jgi:two-component system response regulator QseB
VTLVPVLVVEDDHELAGLLERLLVSEGYDVTVAPDGQRGLHLGLTRAFDVLVLDRGLPAVEGLDLLARLRRSGVTTPVLVLSARGTPQDRVAGLDAGAEDYLAKPFDVDELLARLRALRRRHADASGGLVVPGGRLDTTTRRVTATGGAEIELSARECDLMALLARRPQQVFTRRELLTHVFGDAESESVVDTYVHYLRRKLGWEAISTVRGLGYRLGR